jgi:hypothetical protein
VILGPAQESTRQAEQREKQRNVEPSVWCPIEQSVTVGEHRAVSQQLDRRMVDAGPVLWIPVSSWVMSMDGQVGGGRGIQPNDVLAGNTEVSVGQSIGDNCGGAVRGRPQCDHGICGANCKWHSYLTLSQ